MPVLHIPYKVVSRHAVDISDVVRDLAMVLHGAPADHDPEPITTWESHRKGQTFVDSVDGDTMVLTWALPHRDTHVVAGTLKIILGRIGSEYSAIADLTTMDNRGGAHIRTSAHTYPGDAIKDIWEELWGPQKTWATLTSHLGMPVTPGNPALAASIQSVSLWIYNLAVPLFFVYMAMRVQDTPDAGPENWFTFEQSLLFLVAGAVVLLISALARRILVLNPLVGATARALQELIPHRR